MNSSIKFGHYDSLNVPQGKELNLIRTVSAESWVFKARRFQLLEGFPFGYVDTKKVLIDFTSSSILMPPDDWLTFIKGSIL